MGRVQEIVSQGAWRRQASPRRDLVVIRRNAPSALGCDFLCNKCGGRSNGVLGPRKPRRAGLGGGEDPLPDRDQPRRWVYLIR